jgi:hypothetical protein
MDRRTKGLIAGAGLALGLVAPAASAAPSEFKDLCKNGGWAQLITTSDEPIFKNQGECVAAANHGAFVALPGGGFDLPGYDIKKNTGV